MADITAAVNKIKTATMGQDVRQGIADAMSAVNTDNNQVIGLLGGLNPTAIAAAAVTATTKAAEAVGSATDAMDSEVAAAAAKTAAQTAKTAAELAETHAETAETNAKASEVAAEASETAAAGSAATATTKANESAASAAAALVSEQNAALRKSETQAIKDAAVLALAETTDEAEVIEARKGKGSLGEKIGEIDSQLAEKATKAEVTNVMTPKGTLAYASLPTTGNSVGWYYYCLDGDGTHGAGNYVWNGTSWYFGGTGDEGYNLLKSDLDDFEAKTNSNFITFRSSNYFDKERATVGYQINSIVGNKPVLSANSERVITAEIECTKNDVFYITRIDSNSAFGNEGSSNFACAVALDKNDIILKRSEWVNGFTADVEGATKVRFVIAKSVFTSNKIVNISKNYLPISGKCVEEYWYEKVPINRVNSLVVDMWGDSRIENGYDNCTDVSAYLRDLMNTNVVTIPTFGIQEYAPLFVVNNYGIQAQASGMVAARFGSNEIFVSIYGDKIPSSGEATVTVLRCTTGNVENFNCWSVTPENNVLCNINGINGYLIRSQNVYKFTRIDSGVETSVRPFSKVIVSNKESASHMCVIWAGKNDMGLADGYQINGVIGNVTGMIKKLCHDNFIILGETYDCNTITYGTGTNLRSYVDQINAWYKGNYSNNFIDIQQVMVDNGLTLAGIATPSAKDLENIANGFIPDSLMQDETHPNDIGRQVVAKIIYSWMIEHGWI